jgi:hypothetical protein
MQLNKRAALLTPAHNKGQFHAWFRCQDGKRFEFFSTDRDMARVHYDWLVNMGQIGGNFIREHGFECLSQER